MGGKNRGKNAEKPLIHRAFSHLCKIAVNIINKIDNIASVGLCLTHGRAISKINAAGLKREIFFLQAKKNRLKEVRRQKGGGNPKMRARASPKTGVNPN